jgi:hypothetical protein
VVFKVARALRASLESQLTGQAETYKTRPQFKIKISDNDVADLEQRFNEYSRCTSIGEKGTPRKWRNI